MRQLFVWMIRIVIYPVMAWLGMWVIFPAAGGGVLGIILASPTAALAIFIDISTTAWMRRETIEKAAVKRILFIDSLVSDKRGDEREVRGELEEPDQKHLPRGD